MFPFTSLFGNSRVPPAVRGTAITQGDTLSSKGVQAGDYLFAVTDGGAPTGGGAGAWASLGLNFYGKTVTNVATILDKPFGAVKGLPYRNVGSILLRTTNTSSVSPTIFAGVNKSQNHAGFVAFLSSPPSAAATINLPATWAGPLIFITTSEDYESWDRLYPANTLYADGTSFSWAPDSGGGTINIYELIG